MVGPVRFCGGKVGLGRSLLTDCLVYGSFLVSIVSVVVCLMINSYEALLITGLLLPLLMLICGYIVGLYFAPPITRIWFEEKTNFYDDYRLRRPATADFRFEIELSPKVNLSIERIYAIRLKNVDPFDVNKEFELVDDYNRDGAPVCIELGDFSYEMGLLQPENYEEKYFTIGTEFDVIDVEGGKISTGVITRLIEKEKPQS